MDKTVMLKVNLQNLIVGSGYTIKDFSAKVGVARQHMHLLINGETKDIKLSTAARIAELLGKDILEIWEITQD